MGKKVVFITNNSSLSNEENRSRISRILGIPLDSVFVFSSLDHLARFLETEKIANPLLLLNEEPSNQLGCFSANGTPDAVIVGFFTEGNYEDLKKACLAIQNGARFFLAHSDKRCPTEEGFIPDAGSLGDLVQTVTGKAPAFVGGKPSKEMLEGVAGKFGVDISEIVYFGDRIYTDLEMVRGTKAKGVLMLTGETSMEEFAEQWSSWDASFREQVFLGESFPYLSSLVERILSSKEK